MGILSTIKLNPLLRGTFNLLNDYLGVWKWRMGYVHRTATLIPPMSISGHKNIYLYEHSHIDGHAIILTTRAKFIMKAGAVASVGLTVVSGNHHHEVGRWTHTIKDEEKPEGLDKDVIVDDDALLGAHVTLLAGVHIGRGANIGSGAIVTKSIPPYAIAVGVPAKVVGFKFTPEDMIRHEEILYPSDKRTDPEKFRQLYNSIIKK